MKSFLVLFIILLFSSFLYGQEPPTITVKTAYELDQLLRRQRSTIVPGTTILIAPGDYSEIWRFHVIDIHGTEAAPITIAGLDPNDPPEFGGIGGWYVQNSSHIIFRNLLIRDVPNQNGMLVFADQVSFDELSPSHHLVFENLTFRNIGTPWGESDALKFVYVDYFTIRNNHFEGWAEQAIDMIASQYGVIEDNQFIETNYLGSPELGGNPFVGENATMFTKAGTRHILIQRNLFYNAGLEGLDLGGFSAIYGYRSPIGSTLADGTVVDYEGSDIEVAGNRFYTDNSDQIGAQRPISLEASNRTSVHHNTFFVDNDNPEKGMIYITRTTPSLMEAGIQVSRNGTFSNNLFVFQNIPQYYLINQRYYYPGYYSPETFTFDNNAWYNPLNPPGDGKLDDTYDSINGDLALDNIPPETNGIYGVDPELDLDKNSETYLCASAEFQEQYPNIGADAYVENNDSTEPETPDSLLQFTVIGNAEANSLIKIYNDNNEDNIVNEEDTIIGSIQMTNGQTNFSIVINIQKNQINNFSATATDVASNESTPTDIVVVNDSIAPDIPIIENPTDNIILNADNYLIQGTAEENSLVKIYKNDEIIASEQLDNDNKNFNIVVNLDQDVDNVFSVTATDKYDNESLAALVAIITEDSIPPDPPVITDP